MGKSENAVTLAAVWMNLTRGIAVSAVVIHHSILFIPHQSSVSLFYTVAELVEAVAGTAVHLFFILSGCGLTVSYFKKGNFSWKDWARRRVARIIIPYWVIVSVTFLLANLGHYSSPELIKNGYSWDTLFALLTFTRNFYEPSWGLNPTLWFMPVIVGLYILFPFLLKILEKYGAFVLLTFSILATYGSISLCLVIGYPVSHQTAIPFFYISEFALGMVVGYVLCFHAHQFSRLASLKMFFLGIGLYCISWAMTRFWTMGSSYNDLVTAVGVYLVTLYVCKRMILFSPRKSVELLNRLSKESYVMYLIHGALILFFAKPVLMAVMRSPVNSVVLIMLSGAYCAVIFMIARLLSPPINSLASRLC